MLIVSALFILHGNSKQVADVLTSSVCYIAQGRERRDGEEIDAEENRERHWKWSNKRSCSACASLVGKKYIRNAGYARKE